MTSNATKKRKIECGYELAEAILNQYDYFKGADKDRMLSALAILIELDSIVQDQWISRAIEEVKGRYEELYQDRSDQELLYRYVPDLEQ